MSMFLFNGQKQKINHKHDTCKLNNFIYNFLLMCNMFYFLNKSWALKYFQNLYNSFVLDHLQM